MVNERQGISINFRWLAARHVDECHGWMDGWIDGQMMT